MPNNSRLVQPTEHISFIAYPHLKDKITHKCLACSYMLVYKKHNKQKLVKLLCDKCNRKIWQAKRKLVYY